MLIHAGAGGVGLAAIQMAKAAGATVLTTASSDNKLARLRELGADGGINYTTTGGGGTSLSDAVKDAVKKIASSRQGSGSDAAAPSIDLVIDSVGGRTLQESVPCLAYRGRIS